MTQNTTTPAHCPGFENFRKLSAFTCNCPECGKEIEIFSDEFDRPTNVPAVVRTLTSPSAASRAQEVMPHPDKGEAQ